MSRSHSTSRKYRHVLVKTRLATMLGGIVVALIIPLTQLQAQTTDNVTPETSPIDGLSANLSLWAQRHLGEWAQKPLLGLELWRYVTMFAILFLTLLSAKLTQVVVLRCAARVSARTRWAGDDMLVEKAKEPAAAAITSLGLYLALAPLLATVPVTVRMFVRQACIAAACVAVLWYIHRAINVLDFYLRAIASRSDNDLDDSIVTVIRKSLQLGVIIVGSLFIGQAVLNLRITALLASAGILGLAVAFAAQDTIANLFGTVMLLLDKPFRVGERIVVSGADGPVESVGFRSTRIRTLDGHQVSIPNKDVANTKIENVGRRRHIKRVSNITITYDTPTAKVERALGIIRDILDHHEGMDPEFPPRVYFNQFNDCSLNLLMIAWYHPADYWLYLEWCERTNLAIMKAFEAENIEFAFPTTTTYLAQDDRRPLKITSLHEQWPPEGSP